MHKLVFSLALTGVLLATPRAQAVPTGRTFHASFDDAADPPNAPLASVDFLLEFQTQDRCGYMMTWRYDQGSTYCIVHEVMTFGNDDCTTNASESLDTIVQRAPGPDCRMIWNDGQVYKVSTLVLGEDERTGDLAGIVLLAGANGYVRGLRLSP